MNYYSVKYDNMRQTTLLTQTSIYEANVIWSFFARCGQNLYILNLIYIIMNNKFYHNDSNCSMFILKKNSTLQL